MSREIQRKLTTSDIRAFFQKIRGLPDEHEVSKELERLLAEIFSQPFGETGELTLGQVIDTLAEQEKMSERKSLWQQLFFGNSPSKILAGGAGGAIVGSLMATGLAPIVALPASIAGGLAGATFGYLDYERTKPPKAPAG